MTDRELLEAAARAAGFEVLDTEDTGELFVRSEDGGTWWNPLRSDGDALRLAVELGLIVNFSPRKDCRGQTVARTGHFESFEEPCADEGRAAAARRAIVRAAAAIGREAA